jgi:hypothetical protein
MVNDWPVIVAGHIEALRTLERPDEVDQVTPVDGRDHSPSTADGSVDLELDVYRRPSHR